MTEFGFNSTLTEQICIDSLIFSSECVHIRAIRYLPLIDTQKMCFINMSQTFLHEIFLLGRWVS